ncbi:MAG: AAA family ATPase [Thermoguttaceae bacterium]|nr:AAA family ATPase [Thermoguttaceae bacterium]
MPEYNARYRIMQLPVFPKPSDAQDVDRQFTPEALLDGFLVAPENRLAELAVRIADFGVPVFDRFVGDAPLTPVAAASREPSRADLEFLMSAAKETDAPIDSFFPTDAPLPSPLFLQARYNAARGDSNQPMIIGYRKLEETSFLMPLVFYGQSGAGKTRVIEAVCQTRREKNPRLPLYYLSAHDFARSLADAIRTERTQLFRELFAQASVVAIENADLLAENKAAQLEFLTMLDDAIKARKLIILSFSQPPANIEGFSPDLAARLSAGLLIPVNVPSEETRLAIVERVAAKLALPFDAATKEYCARKLPTTVGAICASLVQLARELALDKTDPTLENVQLALERRNQSREITLDEIIRAVAKRLSVSVVDLRGKRRTKTLVFARKCVVFLARRLTDATYREIGRALARRNHSTILHAATEIDEEMQTNEESALIMREIADRLGARVNF